MAVIGELAVNVLAAKLDKFETDMRKGAKSAERFAQRTDKSMKKVGLAIKAMTGLIIGGGLVKAFNSVTGSIDKLAKTSSKLGIATENLAGLRHAGEQTGVAINTMDMALQRMVRRVSEASKGTGEAVKALQELNLDASKLAAMSPDKQFAAIADAMNKVGNESDQVRLAFKLFDSEGVALVNTLKLGSKGLADMNREAKDLGLAVSRIEAQKIEKFNDTLDKLKKIGASTGRGLVIDVAPELVQAAETLLKAARLLVRGTKATGGALGSLVGGVGTSIVDSNAFQRSQRNRDRGNAQRIGSQVNPFALGFATRGQSSRGVSMEAKARQMLDKQARDSRLQTIAQNPFPTLSGAAAPFANREAGGRIAGSAGKIGQAMAQSVGAGMSNLYKRFRFSRFGNNPLAGVQQLTGIPVGDIADGSYNNKSRERERERPSPLRAVNANSAEGFAALRSNLRGGSEVEQQQLKELRRIAKNTKTKSNSVKEVGLGG